MTALAAVSAAGVGGYFGAHDVAEVSPSIATAASAVRGAVTTSAPVAERELAQRGGPAGSRSRDESGMTAIRQAALNELIAP
jgi:hypothetical protein